MKKIHYSLFSIVLVLLIANSCTGDKFSRYKKFAEETSKQFGLPRILAQGVQMDSIIALSANELGFYYTILQEIAMTPNQFEEEQTPLLIESVKEQAASPLFKAEFDKYKKDNMTLTYVYYDKLGSLLSKISVKPEDYK